MKVVRALVLVAVLASFFVDALGQNQCDFNSDCVDICRRSCAVSTKPLCYLHECYCSPAALSMRPSYLPSRVYGPVPVRAV